LKAFWSKLGGLACFIGGQSLAQTGGAPG